MYYYYNSTRVSTMAIVGINTGMAIPVLDYTCTHSSTTCTTRVLELVHVYTHVYTRVRTRVPPVRRYSSMSAFHSMPWHDDSIMAGSTKHGRNYAGMGKPCHDQQWKMHGSVPVPVHVHGLAVSIPCMHAGTLVRHRSSGSSRYNMTICSNVATTAPAILDWTKWRMKKPGL